MKSHRGRITNKKAFRVAARRYLQVRAEELKNLEEKRAALVEEMEGILNKAQEEERAFEESEQARFDEIEKEINAIDKTIEAKERARNLGNPGGKKKEDGENDDLTVEERAFVDYVRGTLTNERAANLTYADNGAVIPSSIVNKIIEKVVEICPIYSIIADEKGDDAGNQWGHVYSGAVSIVEFESLGNSETNNGAQLNIGQWAGKKVTAIINGGRYSGL